MALALESGDCIGPYRILSSCGVGGTAETFKVDRAGDGVGVRFAKVFFEPTLLDKRRPERIVEFRFLQDQLRDRLNRAAFGARILDFFVFKNHFVKVTEFIHGDALTEVLPRADADKQWDVALSFMFALKAAHGQGVANLDLKPDAVLVTKPMVGGVVGARMIDFDAGWVNADLRPGRKFRRSGYAGTPGYFSPDYFLWLHEDPKQHFPEFPSDIFTAGLVLFEIFAKKHMVAALGNAEPGLHAVEQARRGKVAGVMPRIDQVARQFPKEVSDIVERMLVVSPGKRPSAAEVHETLRSARIGRTGLTLRIGGQAKGIVMKDGGASVALDAKLEPRFKGMLGRVFYDVGKGFLLQAFQAGVALNGKPVPTGMASTPVKGGDRIVAAGVQVELA